MPAFEAAIDDQLDAADADKIIAFVLLDAPFGDGLVHLLRRAEFEARHIDRVAQGQRMVGGGLLSTSCSACIMSPL